MAHNGAKSGKDTIDARQRMFEVLELRKQGLNFRQIADRVDGISNPGNAYRLFKKALTEVTREPAEEVLTLELERLDTMLVGLWKRASTGDEWAIDRVLKIMDRRARYLGLDELTEPDPSKDARTALAEFMASAITAAAGMTTTPDGHIIPTTPPSEDVDEA